MWPSLSMPEPGSTQTAMRSSSSRPARTCCFSVPLVAPWTRSTTHCASPALGSVPGQGREQMVAEVGQGQVHVEDTALTGLAFERQRPTVQGDQLAGDGESKTDPFRTPIVISRGKEWLENVFLAVNRNAVARIAHPYVQVRRRHRGAQFDLTLHGELARVAEQIQDDLAQPGRIGLDERQPRRQVQPPRQARQWMSALCHGCEGLCKKGARRACGKAKKRRDASARAGDAGGGAHETRTDKTRRRAAQRRLIHC